MCAVVAGCTPPVQKAPPAPKAAPARVFPASPLAPLPSAIATFGDVACTFRTKGIFHVAEGADGAHEPLKLRLTDGGPPYAHVPTYDEAVVETRVGPRAPARATLVVPGGIRVSGLVDLDSVDLHAARPFLVGGLFEPKEYTKIRWESGRPGEATISIALRHVRAPAELLRGSRSCADLSAGWQWFPPPDKERPWVENAILAAGETGISSTPDAPSSATIIVGDKDDRLVSVSETRGDRSNIVLYADQALITGWVPRSALTATNEMAARDYFPSSTMFGVGQHPSPIRVACSSEIPLIAEVSGDRRAVGTIRAGTPIGIDERGKDFSVASFTGPSAVLGPAPGARLLVRTGDLGGCKMLADE
jgi:hypothetical protein